MSEDNDDFSEHDEDFDIEQAVQAIDNVHHKAKRERKSRSSITVSEDGYPPGNLLSSKKCVFVKIIEVKFQKPCLLKNCIR